MYCADILAVAIETNLKLGNRFADLAYEVQIV